MRFRAASKTVALNYASKAFTFGNSSNINQVAGLE
jgi:hypothetical protein